MLDEGRDAGIHTVKVRPATPDIKRALETRKMFNFMISTSEMEVSVFQTIKTWGFYKDLVEGVTKLIPT